VGAIRRPGVALQRYRTLLSDSALWDGFAFREGDIVISTPAKCGTTWMQMLCALLIFDTTELDRPLTELSPWLDATFDDHASVVATLDAQEHRRFIKTHTPFDGLALDERVTCICVGRDPRDVAVSYARSMANLDPDTFAAARAAAGIGNGDLRRPPADPRERFWQWIDGGLRNDQRGAGATLARMVKHVETFWDRRDEPQVLLFHYGDLLADLPGQLCRLGALLSIPVSEERAAELAAAARFERMRDNADQLAPGVNRRLWRDNRAFFHSGGTGQWRDLLGPDDRDRYEERLAQLASPELADWLHAGHLGSPGARW
jgi:aryl sulfotransferase